MWPRMRSMSFGIGAVVPAGEPVREADDRLQAVLPGRRERLPDFVELLRAEIALLEGLQVDLDQQQGDPALAQAIQPADAVAHARRVEATLRVREGLGALPVADLPPCRRLLGWRPPRREAQGDEDAEGQGLSAHGRHRFRSAWDRPIIPTGRGCGSVVRNAPFESEDRAIRPWAGGPLRGRLFGPVCDRRHSPLCKRL